MNINLTAKHSKIPQNAKEYAQEKAEKLEKFYRLRKVDIVMDMEGDSYCVELVTAPDGGSTVVSKALGDDWLSAVDQSIDKAERQLRKLKGKVKSHRMKKYKENREEESDSGLSTY